MDPIKNPFAPGAGTPPPLLVGRQSIIIDTEIALARIREKRSSKGVLMVGLRGVGKTVLLVEIQERAKKLKYEVVKIEAPEDKDLPALLIPPLREVLLRLDRMEGAGDMVKRALRIFKGFSLKLDPEGAVSLGLNIDVEVGVGDSGDLEADLTSLFLAIGEAAESRKTAVALMIDEMQYISRRDLGALIAAVHAVGQQQLPLVLVGAGLPQLVALAGEAKSYAERLFTYPKIGALNDKDAEKALREPVAQSGVDFKDDAVKEILKLTRGYPYFIQEWGYETWNLAKTSPISLADVKTATPNVIAKLDESFFRVRFDRLTPSERDYLRAMAQLGPGPHRSGDITNVLGVKVESKGPTRSSLIAKGMIFSPAHGDTAFTVPLFDQFMLRTLPDWKPRQFAQRTKTDAGGRTDRL